MLKKQVEEEAGTKLKISIVAICLGVYFMMMPFDSFSMFGMGSLLRIVVLLPIGAIIGIKLRTSVQLNPLTVVFLIYCLSLAASCFYSINQSVSFGNVKRILLNMAVIVCVGGMYDYNEREIEFLKKSLVTGGLATLLLTFLFADLSEGGRLTLSINGDTQDQNYLNGYLFFAYVYFFGKLIENKKLIMLIPVGGILFFTLMTGSRGALLALAGISAVSIFFVLWREHKLNISTIVLIAVILIFLMFLYEPVLSLLPEEVGERFSLEYIAENGSTGRSAIWVYLLNRYMNSDIFRMLFGYGYATVVLVNEYNHLVAHNLWIDHLIMGGLFGELIFLAMQFTFIRAAWKSKDVFLIGSYVGYLIMMLTLSLLSYKPVWNCMMMIMIITRYQRNKLETEESVKVNGQKLVR